MSKELEPLEPVDYKQCQAEVHNGYTFMTLGGVPGMVRCKNPAAFVATELKPDADGRAGAMSVCSQCFPVMQEQMPGHCRFDEIKPVVA